MQYFIIISGLASILGFILTVANILPSYAKQRNYFTIFAFGTFIGSFIGGIKNININFPENPISSGVLLFYIISLAGLLLLLITAAFSDDRDKRKECFTIVSGGFGLLVLAGMVILFGIGLGQATPKEEIPLDDLLTIAEINVGKGNIDRAIIELGLFANACPTGDLRKKAALRRIEELKSQQSKLIVNK